MNVTAALMKVGFELRQDPIDPGLKRDFSVLRGTAEAEPVFGFGGAWSVSQVLWVDGERREGEFLICQDPGTGNVVQWFDLKN